MENWKKGKERERERERDTERVRRGRGRWRSGDWSRSSRGWGERRRIGKAIRSCLGLIPLLLRTPIPLAKSTLDLRSFSLSLSFFRSYYYSFLFPHRDKFNCFFWRRPSCCYCFDTLTLTVVALVGAICKTKWGFGFLLEECESVKLNQLWWFLGFQILKNIWTFFLKSKMVIIYHAFLVLKIQFQLTIKIVKLCFKNKIFTIFMF